MAYEIHKFAGVMHAIVVADGALEAKDAQVTNEKQHFEGFKKRKNRDRNGKKSNKSKQNDNTCYF